MNIKGNAAATEAVCNASNPPENNRDVAKRDCTNPHNIFLPLLGFKSPSDVSIPKTNVAELADVIKNVTSKTTVIKDIRVLRG